jgi:hypothetical protein
MRILGFALVFLVAGCVEGGPATERSHLRAQLVRSVFTEDSGQDRDGDGLLDEMEGELAFVFRPYLVFDSAEEARESREPIVLFQVRLSDVQGVTSDGTRIWRLSIKWVFLFRDDGGYGPASSCSDDHEGDNDDALFELESRDSGVSWRLVRAALSSRGADNFAGPDWPARSDLDVRDLTHPILFMSAHKHHEYFNTEWDHEDSLYSDVPVFDDCNDDVNGEGDAFMARVHSIAIEEGHFTSFSRDHNNVGELDAHPSPPFVDDLGVFFPGHSAWGTGKFYEVDPIREKWLV